MKNCFKLFLTAAILLLSVNSYALLPISLGIKGGVNLSNVGGDVDDNKSKAGFNAGLVMDIDIPLTSFGIMTGIEFTTKGAKIETRENVGDYSAFIDGKINASYLQLPVHATYKMGLAPATSLKFHAGPYFAYGIGGKSKITDFGVNGLNLSRDEMMDALGLKESDLKSDTFGSDGFDKFDFGLGIGVGLQVWKFGVDLGWDFGLTNISGDSDYKVRNRNGYLSFSYRFM